MAKSEPSPYHPIRAVAIDLDGTLLSPDLSISAENHAAIESLAEAGVEIILASGRHYQSMLPHARKLPQVHYMVSSQGAYASDLENQNAYYESYLSTEDARAAIEFGLAENLAVVVYTPKGLRSLTQPGKWLDYYTNLAGIKPQPSTAEAVLEGDIFKVIYFEEAERLDEIEQKPFISESRLYTVRSLVNIFEQANATTSKASALKPLLAHLGISPDELASFGDANNDIPMFEISRCSVAMDRAWDTAKQAATLVAPDGPAESSFARAVAAMVEHFKAS